MRMRNKPWAMDFLASQSYVDLDMKYKGNIQALFDNEAPIHLEVGTGMGTFITTLAERHPEINFVGVELDKNILIRVCEKINEKKLSNIRLLLCDANTLNTYFLPHEVSKIYLNFSDPWPKKRHAKRRLTHHSFLSVYKDILKDKGEIEFKTDNRGLFEFSLMSLQSFGMTFNDINLDVHCEEDEKNIRTEYEEKFSKKGNKIYKLNASF